MPVRQFLRNLQTRKAFITAFTSEKREMTIKKSLFRHWPLLQNFFIVYFPSLYDVKPKARASYCAFGQLLYKMARNL
jgi:hypothetical protein